MKEEMEFAAREFPKILTEHREAYRMFKKNTYADAFFAYKKACAPGMKNLERLVLTAPECREELVEECMEQLFTFIRKEAGKKRGLFRTDLLQGFKMDLALFAVPAILHMELSLSEELAESIVERWGQEYPKNRFLKGTFDEISAGFAQKGACYITTAVCDALGKEEDGYELKAFRKFRDEYLLRKPYGADYVNAYYDSAPGIVHMIGWEDERERVYQEIWEQFLKPCLRALEQERPEACEKGYVKMVRELERKYMPFLCHTPFLK